MLRSFASDNRAGASPEVLEAIAREAASVGGAYGDDAATESLVAKLAEIFEHEVWVYPVLTGTAANSLALACLTDPWGAVTCHSEAHVYVDESGAPEFYGHGLRLVPVAGEHGRISSEDLRSVAAAPGDHGVHSTPLQAVSITDSTEVGTRYSAAEIGELCDVAASAGLKVHLDGARFANAVAAGADSPADLTWRAGVDVAVVGGTKNGALGAEAVVFFEPGLAATVERRRKRGGHLASKLRVLSAQLDALLTDDLWLRNARHANRCATVLAGRLHSVGLEPAHPVDTNMVFVEVDVATADRWLDAGVEFYDERAGGRSTVRFVTSFATSPDEIDTLMSLLAPGTSVV